MFIKPKKKFWLSSTSPFYAASGGSTPFAIAWASLAVSTTGATTTTFTAQGIGTADATRIVVVGILLKNSSSAISVSNVTINGSNATQATSAVQTATSAASDIWYLAVPSGTTANIVITTTGTAFGRISAVIYSVVGTGCAFGTAGGSISNVGTATTSATLTPPAGGGTIGVAIIENTGTVTPLNLTQDSGSPSTQGVSLIVYGHDTASSGSTLFKYTWGTSGINAGSFITFSP